MGGGTEISARAWSTIAAWTNGACCQLSLSLSLLIPFFMQAGWGGTCTYMVHGSMSVQGNRLSLRTRNGEYSSRIIESDYRCTAYISKQPLFISFKSISFRATPIMRRAKRTHSAYWCSQIPQSHSCIVARGDE